MQLSRDIVRPDIVFDTHLGDKTAQEFFDRIDDFKAFLSTRKLEGKQVCVSHEAHFDFLALIFALLECKINFRSCLVNTDNIETYLKDSEIVFWRNTGNEDISQWSAKCADPTDVPVGYGHNKKFKVYKDGGNSIWYSTGTTGEPSKVIHTHESMLNPALIAKDLFYSSNDTYYATATIAHAGVFPIGFLAPLMKVKRFILHPLEDGIDAFHVAKADICLLFYYQYKNHPELESMKFNKTRVITGGEPLRNFWAQQLFEQGVEVIHNVYGTTQTLPPIFIKDYFPGEVVTNELGNLLKPYSASFKEDVLWIGAPWYESTPTGDSVSMLNGKYYFNGRDSLCFRRNGVLVDPDTVKFVVEKNFANRIKSAKVVNVLARGEEVLQLYYVAEDDVDLQEVNACITEELGGEHVVHGTFKVDELAFNAIYKIARPK